MKESSFLKLQLLRIFLVVSNIFWQLRQYSTRNGQTLRPKITNFNYDFQNAFIFVLNRIWARNFLLFEKSGIKNLQLHWFLGFRTKNRILMVNFGSEISSVSNFYGSVSKKGTLITVLSLLLWILRGSFTIWRFIFLWDFRLFWPGLYWANHYMQYFLVHLNLKIVFFLIIWFHWFIRGPYSKWTQNAVVLFSGCFNSVRPEIRKPQFFLEVSTVLREKFLRIEDLKLQYFWFP